MKLVLLTALGVGGATVIGSVLGFVFKGPFGNSVALDSSLCNKRRVSGRNCRINGLHAM